MSYRLKAKNEKRMTIIKKKEIIEHIIISYANNRKKRERQVCLTIDIHFQSEAITLIYTVYKYQLNFFKNSSAHIRARELTANFISLISLSISSRK
jgi:hypothetical protein